MKHLQVLFIGIALIGAVHASAQTNYKIGVNVGLNYPDLRGHEYAKYQNYKVGQLFGVTLDYNLQEQLSVKASVNYEQKLKKFRITYFDYDAEESGKEDFKKIYSYINVPILLKYKFGSSPFFANAGPFLNYLLSSKTKPEYHQDTNGTITAQKDLDFGFSIGFGASIALNDKHDLTLEIRDDFGVIDTGDVPKHVGGSAKTNTLKLILGYNLGL